MLNNKPIQSFNHINIHVTCNRPTAKREYSCHDNNNAYCACTSVRINKCGNLKQSVRGQGCLGLSFCSLSLPLFAQASFIVSDRLSCYPSIERCAWDRCRIYRSYERRHILEAYGNPGSCKPLHGCQANKQHIQSTVNSGHWSPWTLIERNSAEVKITFIIISIKKLFFFC